MASRRQQSSDAVDPATEASESAEAQPAAAEEPRPPQGITVRRKEGEFHRIFRTIEVVDPASLRVPKKRPSSGEDFLDDPYLAIPKPTGGFAITQVGAEQAAEMLTCHPVSGGPATCRLATDDEIAAHLAVNGPGGHGNLINRK